MVKSERTGNVGDALAGLDTLEGTQSDLLECVVAQGAPIAGAGAVGQFSSHKHNVVFRDPTSSRLTKPNLS